MLNLTLWIIIPSLISSLLTQGFPTLPLANLRFILTFGIIITGLQVLGAITDGMAISVPFVSGAHLASAFYIWELVAGGTLSLSAEGVSVTLSLQTLLFLLVLPSLFGAVRAPVEFLMERSEAGLPARDIP